MEIKMTTSGTASAWLDASGPRVVPLMRKAMEVTARNIKDQAQASARSIDNIHARRYPSTISYDFKPSLTHTEIEIGPTLGGQGSLGGILEEGGIHNAPQNNLTNALRSNLADFEKGMALAAEQALR